MEKINVLVLFFSVLMLVKSLYNSTSFWFFKKNKESITIEKFEKKQGSCFLITSLYHIFVSFIWMWVIFEYSNFAFNINCEYHNLISSLFIVTIISLFIIFFTVKSILNKKYELSYFNDELINYRSTLEEYSDENTFEVSFINAYKKVEKNQLVSIILMAFSLITYIFII